MLGFFVLSILSFCFSAVNQLFTRIWNLSCLTVAKSYKPFILGIRNPTTIGMMGYFGEFLSISVYFGGNFFNEIQVVDGVLYKA